MVLMPKGGDIHAHYSGTIPTEELIAAAVAANLYLCVTKGTPAWGYAVTAPEAFTPGGAAGATHFFDTFGRFGTASDALSAAGRIPVGARAAAPAARRLPRTRGRGPSRARHLESARVAARCGGRGALVWCCCTQPRVLLHPRVHASHPHPHYGRVYP